MGREFAFADRLPRVAASQRANAATVAPTNAKGRQKVALGGPIFPDGWVRQEFCDVF